MPVGWRWHGQTQSFILQSPWSPSSQAAVIRTTCLLSPLSMTMHRKPNTPPTPTIHPRAVGHPEVELRPRSDSILDTEPVAPVDGMVHVDHRPEPQEVVGYHAPVCMPAVGHEGAAAITTGVRGAADGVVATGVGARCRGQYNKSASYCPSSGKHYAAALIGWPLPSQSGSVKFDGQQLQQPEHVQRIG